MQRVAPPQAAVRRAAAGRPSRVVAAATMALALVAALVALVHDGDRPHGMSVRARMLVREETHSLLADARTERWNFKSDRGTLISATSLADPHEPMARCR